MCQNSVNLPNHVNRPTFDGLSVIVLKGIHLPRIQLRNKNEGLSNSHAVAAKAVRFRFDHYSLLKNPEAVYCRTILLFFLIFNDDNFDKLTSTAVFIQ